MNTLIINLKRFGDIYCMAHLLNSMAKNNRQEVTLLIYKEFYSVAKNLKHVSNIICIDRAEVEMFRKNPLFSNGFAINSLETSLRELKVESWDNIFNYSNENVGIYLASYLGDEKTNIIGTSISRDKNINTSNEWSLVFNDVLSIHKATPFHFTDCYHRMANIPFEQQGDKIVTTPSYDETAFKNISHIRNNESVGGEKIHIVGIQLLTSRPSKDLSFETIVNILDCLLDSKSYYPILLIAANDEERQLAKNINIQFNDTLITVESDFSALSSVLSNIDALITPDTAIKHLADLLSVPIVEISCGDSPMFKQGTINTGNLIIRSEDSSNISHKDVIECLEYVVRSIPIASNFSENITIYRPSYNKDFGTYYLPIAGKINHLDNIERIMSRVTTLNMLEGDANDLISEVLRFDREVITRFITAEKNALNEITRDLLGTLRSLIHFSENKNKVSSFISSLDNLLTYSSSGNLCSIPTIFFQSKIENIPSNIQDREKLFESELYILKNRIQVVYKTLRTLEDLCFNDRKRKFITKSKEVSATT